MSRAHVGPALIACALLAAMAHAEARSPIAPTSEQRLPDGQRLLVLCYHDVVPALPSDADRETIETAAFASQLDWLRSEGYVAIDLDQLLRAYAGAARLPERAVLLTFDDGYESVYSQVFPLLRAYRMPAVVALVGRWMEAAAGQSVRYGERDLARERFLTWEQARAMQDSGLVEFASHSWDLHHGIEADTPGYAQPAATARIALGGGRIEDDAAWTARVRADLERNNAVLAAHLGRAPRAIAWPYGRYNTALVELAQSLGLPVGLTLDSGRDDQPAPIGRMRRLLVDHSAGLARFAQRARQQDEPPNVRFVEFELDRLAGGDARSFEARLQGLIERIRRLGAETVVLRASAAPGASGRIESVYFRNRRLPVGSDILGPAAWRIAAATGARVFASMPLDGWAFDATADDSGASDALGDLFEDLGKAAAVRGLLLGPVAPDAPLEGASTRAQALAARARAWQPELASALRLAPIGPAQLPDRIRAALRQHDYVVLDAADGHDAAADRQLVSAVRQVDGAAPRTVIALSARPAVLADTAQRAQALVRAELANLGLVGLDPDLDEAALAPLRALVSPQSRAAARPKDTP